MLSFFLIAGMSYLFFLVTLFDGGDSFGAYVPWLFIIFSFPHFMATYWVWGSRVKNWKKEWLPLIFPALYLGIFLAATKGLLGEHAVEVILKFSYLYLLYHFAQQLYGVTLWLNLKSGVFYSAKRKWLLRALYLIACLYAWLEMEMRGVVNILFYHSVSSWNLPSEFISTGFFLIFVISIMALTFCFYDYFKFKKLSYLLPAAPIGVAWLWFIPPFNQKMIFLLPVFHGIQYLPFIKMKGRSLSGVYWLMLSCVFVASGWVFFRWLPFQVTMYSLEGTLWPALILTLLNNHHFLIDGRIWKLRDVQNHDLLDNK